MSATIASYRTSDGYEIKYRHWSAQSEQPRGYVVALHGIQSHSGWYDFSCSKMAHAGYEVAFLDRRGSGLNSRQRGDALHVDRLINDVAQFINQQRYQRDPQAPLILLAVSWGGKLAATVTARHPQLVDALALLDPGICARIEPTRWQLLQLKLAELSGITARRVDIPLTDPALFTQSKEWQKFITNDPFRLHDVTIQFLLANRQLDEEVKRSAEQISCPTLLLLAGQDRIIDNLATENYFQRLAAEQKKCITFPNAAHTLEFEENRKEIFTTLINWLDSL